MSIIEKAHDLAEAIADSQELQEMRNAEIVMYQNTEAAEGLRLISEKQESLRDSQASGKEITQEQIDEIYQLQEKVQNMGEVQLFLQAQNRFNQLLQTVNFIIERAISGDEDEDGCGSGNCSSGCGGGCCG